MIRYSWTSPEAITLITGLFCAGLARLRRRRLRKFIAGVLDTVLFDWSKGNPFTVRDLVNGGVAIFGITGSGKTTSSGRLLIRKIVRFQKSGGLILAAKPEDRAFFEAIFAEAGRSTDLKVFGPGEALKFNFLDYAQRLSNEPSNTVHCLQILGECLKTADGSGSGNESFWKHLQEQMLYTAVVVVKLARGGEVTAPDLQTFIGGAACDPTVLSDPAWRAGEHCKWLEAAHRAAKSETEILDCNLAEDYWLGQYPSMADKTRSCVVAGVLGILHVFNTGTVRSLVSGPTNVTPDEMFSGRWILIDMSPATWGVAGTFVCAGWRYLTQRAVLKRKVGEDDLINVIWMDEAQVHVNSHDSVYIALCRSHRGCMVMLSQSLPGYYAAMPGDTGEHQTRALLGNFSHVIVHAVDATTAEWAAGKLGKRRETFFGGSIQPAKDGYDELFGSPSISGSFSEHYENVLQESVFMNGLRTGSQANGYLCDAVVIRSAKPFANGENWLFRSFSQRDSDE